MTDVRPVVCAGLLFVCCVDRLDVCLPTPALLAALVLPPPPLPPPPVLRRRSPLLLAPAPPTPREQLLAPPVLCRRPPLVSTLVLVGLLSDSLAMAELGVSGVVDVCGGVCPDWESDASGNADVSFAGWRKLGSLRLARSSGGFPGSACES